MNSMRLMDLRPQILEQLFSLDKAKSVSMQFEVQCLVLGKRESNVALHWGEREREREQVCRRRGRNQVHR
jgi:hypothetical protein